MSTIEQEVRNRLRKLRLDVIGREEVFAEITAHLESLIEEMKIAGLDASRAEQQALSQLGDVDRLCKRIQRDRTELMRDAFRRVWLPAGVVILLVYWPQMLIYRFFPEPRAYHIFGTYYVFSWGWLLAEALAGAFGAWWSRHAGGTVRERLIVALAPAEAMGIVVALVLTSGTVVQFYADHRAPYFVSHPLMILAALFWVLHPVLPALMGALPFLRGGPRQPDRHVLA